MEAKRRPSDKTTTFMGIRRLFLNEIRGMRVGGIDEETAVATKEAISSLTGDDRDEALRRIHEQNHLKGQTVEKGGLLGLKQWADEQGYNFQGKVVAPNAVVVVKNDDGTYEGYWIAASLVSMEAKLSWRGHRWIPVTAISLSSPLAECLIGRKVEDTVVCTECRPPRRVTIEAIG